MSWLSLADRLRLRRSPKPPTAVVRLSVRVPLEALAEYEGCSTWQEAAQAEAEGLEVESFGRSVYSEVVAVDFD
ncbi:MAG: hypothetical protein AAGM22_21490 [Acidobacteriota bacterium]